MASIGEPTPPPRLIAHSSIQENIYVDTEEEQDGLFMKDIHRNNSNSRSHYYPTEHLHKRIQQNTNKSHQQEKNSAKANHLRTEISRLREEIMFKINALESEMTGHTQQQRDIIRHTSSAQSVQRKDQTTQTAESVHFDKLSWERKLLGEIDERFDSLRKEIFDKLDSMINDGRVASPVWNPKKKITTTSHSPQYHTSTSSGHQHSNSEPKDTSRSFDVLPRDNYHRIFEPYMRKSPISHHYSSSPAIRENSTSNEHSLNRGLYYEQYHTFTTIDQFTQTAREELSRHLVDQWFPYDDLADANVRGVKGKRLLNPSKIQKIRETVFKTYPLRNNENEEYLWKVICDKINAKCRGVTRTLKRKGNTNDYLPYSHDAILSSSMIGSQHSSKYRKDSFDYDDTMTRCSFVSTTHQSIANNHQPRSSSSSDSDTGSVDMATTVPPKSPEKTTPAPRVSSVSCFSSSVKVENSEVFPSTKSLEGEEINVRVIDEEDSRSDGTSSNENNPEMDERSNSSPKIQILHDPISALEICDQLAEKYMDHFPQAHDTSDKKRLQGNREEFTRTLIEAMFTRSTLAHSNVTGARGKFMLDPVKIAKVRETVFRKFPSENEDEEEVIWKILTTKINTKCRGVKRLMKRKGMPADCISGNMYQNNEQSFDKFTDER